MFTGIVETTGTIRGAAADGSGVRLEIVCGFAAELSAGESVAVDGACLTVTAFDAHAFSVTAVTETLARTTLGSKAPGDVVNLERALRVGDRIDGHLLGGHVDGVGTVERVSDDAPGRRVRIRLPRELARFVAEKGSIAVDGVSLTPARVDEEAFEVALVPHTLRVTTLVKLESGRRVNLEVDLLARYVERLRSFERGSVEAGT